MPSLLLSHADRLRATRKKAERRAYDANVKMQPGTKEHVRYRSSRRWQKVRDVYLNSHPACNDPYGVHGDQLAAADQVDHVISLARGGVRAADWNLQSLCTSCHARKSQAERAEA